MIATAPADPSSPIWMLSSLVVVVVFLYWDSAVSSKTDESWLLVERLIGD